MQICNEGLKLMLKDCTTSELEEYKDKVSAVGAAFSKDTDMQGATFAYVLYKMTEHVQVEQIHNLQVTMPFSLICCFALCCDAEPHGGTVYLLCIVQSIAIYVNHTSIRSAQATPMSHLQLHIAPSHHIISAHNIIQYVTEMVTDAGYIPGSMPEDVWSA